jgi:protein-S-isoprenylcysteine O-methyltransferase Ste14
MLFLRSLLFAALIPGTVIVLIPQWILSRTRGSASGALMRSAGLLLILVGGSVVLWCIWDFARHGRGTLAPVDPPKHLVVHLFVVFYEEPTLRRSFGASYSQYCLTVRRWVPFA